MSQPRLALVGSVHALPPWLVRSIPRCATFEAICDDNADQDVGKYHARWAFADLETLLRESEPHGVVLSVPFKQRPKAIKTCLSRGIGVLVPGAAGPAASCKRLSSFARLAGRALLASSPARYAPAVLLAKRLLDSGQLGPPTQLTIQSTWRGHRFGDPVDCGPISFDQVFEALHLVHLLAGPLQRVFAVSHDDGATVATAMTGHGVPVSLVFHPSGPAEAAGLEVEIRSTDGGRLTIDTACRLVSGCGSKPHAHRQIAMATADPAIELGCIALLTEFTRLLRPGRSAHGLVGPVAMVTAGAEAVLASIARGRPVAPKMGRSVAGAAERPDLEVVQTARPL